MIAPLSPKARAKVTRSQQKVSSAPVPSRWEDFARLCTIRSGGEMRQFVPYPYQRLLIDLAQKYPNILILKSRQLGITQALTAKFLHDACLSPAASSILFMRNGEDASAISRRTRQMLTSISEYAKATNDNVGYLKIADGGDLYFKNSSRQGSRSLDSITGMLFDESAFIENIEEIYAASSPSSALSQGKIQKFIVSTPSARNGWYWNKLNENNGNIDIEQLAIDVADGKISGEIPGTYHFVDRAKCCKLILHWKAHPVYREIPNYLQYRLEQDGTDWETVLREYDLRFVDSAVSIFDANLVALNAIGSYEQDRDNSACYFIGVDPNFGGNDFCTAPVLKWDGQVFNVVDCYRKRKETSDYHLYHIRETIEKWQPERVGVETNGGGKIYLEQLTKWFPNIEFIDIRTSESSKPVMISRLRLALEREAFIFPANSPLKDELLTFRQQGKRLEAAPGKHDDYVMGSAIALTAANQEPKKKGFHFTSLPVR